MIDTKEFDNISVSKRTIIASGFLTKAQSLLGTARLLRKEMDQIQLQKAQTISKGTRKKLLFGFNSNVGESETFHDVEIFLLTEYIIHTEQVVKDLQLPNFSTTVLLNYLDNILDIQATYFEINQQLSTSTNHNPIIFMLRNTIDKSLEFLQTVVTKHNSTIEEKGNNIHHKK